MAERQPASRVRTLFVAKEKKEKKKYDVRGATSKVVVYMGSQYYHPHTYINTWKRKVWRARFLLENAKSIEFESMVGAWFPTSKKRKQNVGCLLGQSGKVWNWKEATRSFLGRAWKKQVWKKEECRRTNWRRFDRIFNDTPVNPPPRFSIGGFPPQESRGGKFAAIPRPHTTPRESRIERGHAINWIE